MFVGVLGFQLNSWTLLAVFSCSNAFEIFYYSFAFTSPFQVGRLVVQLALWILSEIRRSQLQFYWFVPYR